VHVTASATLQSAIMVEWCEQEALLTSLYGFSHLPCSQLQSNTSITSFCHVFSTFVASLVRHRHTAVTLNWVLCPYGWALHCHCGF
jgi:hypothetical protein